MTKSFLIKMTDVLDRTQVGLQDLWTQQRKKHFCRIRRELNIVYVNISKCLFGKPPKSIKWSQSATRAEEEWIRKDTDVDSEMKLHFD